MQERTGAVTFKGQPITLLGPEPRIGDPAPEFSLTTGDLSNVTREILLDEGRRAALLIAVPSLDTPVCSLESQKFNQRLGEIPGDVAVAVVSMDLPFAQARWCAAQGDVKLQMLSDYRDHSFGLNYGLMIRELGFLARAVIIVAKDGTISYVEIVPEIAAEPDYDRALQAAAAVA
ncbi:MAG: thiol peroxidase [Candidatus Eremiobacteraeota bacterium]|nr:thiol peroxidase [Candidatus Eremiobacteraeota bacterium]MBV8499608.1 thiol peroxidase [Candidatus Eremiobacteraeota bacterium]